MKEKFYWQDWVATAIGLWVAASPWIIPMLFPQAGPIGTVAVVNMTIVGLAIVAISWAAITTLENWEEWVNVALGTWLAISPFVLGYAANVAFLWSAILSGAALVVVEIWSRYSRPLP
jgi:hypothetical protein